MSETLPVLVQETKTYSVDDLGERAVEHSRLKEEVVKAARADREAETHKPGDIGIDRLVATRRMFRAAVTALIEFESKGK